MKQILFLLMAFYALSANAADYYWVGGTGNWSAFSTHWATTSGGASFHTQVPTSADNVFFDANSFSGTGQTVTADLTTISCNDMNWTGVTNSPTFNMNNKLLYIYGSLTMVSGMTTSNFYCCTNSITFKATSTGKTITTGGRSIGQVWFDGVGGEWSLQDALTAPGGVFLQNGSFITNNQTLNIYYFSSNYSNTRNLNIGSSTINVSYGQPWEITSTNLTFSSTTPTINASGGGSFIGGSKSYYNINFTGSTAGTISGVTSANDISFAANGTLTGSSSTFNNVTFTGNATINGSNTFNNLSFGAGKINTFAAGTTQTVNGTFTSGSSCAAYSVYTSSSTSPAIISKSSGSVTIDYAGLSNITGTGGATFTANNALASGTNAGWTVNSLTPRTFYWIGGSGNWLDGSHWSLSSGGSASNCTPTPVDNVYFDGNSFTAASQSVTANNDILYCNDMDWTGVTNTPTLNMNSKLLYIYGSLTMVSGMSTSNFYCCTNSLTFKATSTGKTITTGGRSIGQVWFDGVGGEWTLQDALTAPGGIFLQNGSFITNNQTLTIFYFNSNYTNTRSLNLGSSEIIVSYNEPWTFNGTNLTLTSTTPRIIAKGGGNFIGGSKSYYDISFTGSAAATISGVTSANNIFFAANGTLSGTGVTFNNATFGGNATINGSNTFNDLTFYSGTTNTIQAGKVQTINGTFTATGTASLPITITASASTTISKASGTACLDYLSLNNIAASGGATFDAGTNSTSSGSSGFVFTGSCTLPTYPSHLWKGANTTWTTTTNWSPAVAPTSSNNVIILNNLNSPIVSATQGVKDITVNANATLTVNSTGNLQISGSITNNGTLTATAGTISMTGASAQIIPASAFSTNTIKNLTINNNAGVTLAGALNITGTYTPTAGTLATGNFLTLKSDASATARVAAGSSLGGYITGNVAVERYIRSKTSRKWSYVASPVTVSTIRSGWQDDVFITGSGTGGTVCGAGTGDGGGSDRYNSNGFDVTGSGNPSLYNYNATQVNGSRWVSVANTNVVGLTPGKGYRMNIRGPRGASDANCNSQLNYPGAAPAPTVATLSATGTLAQGDVSTAVYGTTSYGASNAYSLIGNPYASEVSLQAFLTDNSTITSSFWFYTPSNSGNLYSTYNASTLQAANFPSGYTNGSGVANVILASGQSFFVQRNQAADATVTFKETHKSSTATTGNNFYRTQYNITDKLRVDFNSLTDAEAQTQIFINYLNGPGTSLADATEFDTYSFNTGNNHYLVSDKAGKLMAIQTRPAFTGNDTVSLFIKGDAGNFKFIFSEYADFTSADVIKLLDAYTNTETNIRSNPEYNFSIDANAASQGANRFKIVFKTSTALPVSYINLNAERKNNLVQLNWNVGNEYNMSSYTAERSEDARNFNSIGTLAARGNNNNSVKYSMNDNQPIDGTAYYRIKAISRNNEVKYSPVVKLKMGKAVTLHIYPNPVQDRLSLVLNDPSALDYTIRITNMYGVEVMRKINVLAQNGVIKVNTSALSAGVYTLQLWNNKQECLTESFVKQ